LGFGERNVVATDGLAGDMPNEGGDPPGPILGGVSVLDLSRFLSGPQATLFLAGMGAEVIKIDESRGGDPTFGALPYFGAGLTQRRTSALQSALVDGSVLERFRKLSALPVAAESATPDALKAKLTAEITRWKRVLQSEAIK
jgi:hypothetical protein